MTKDEFLHAALALFKSHFRTDDATGSMTAARAGLLLKKHFPDALVGAGFQKFRDLLRELEHQGSIRTGLDSKNVLAIWFPEAAPPRGPFRLLRDDVWRAFIARRPEGNRYFNLTTGEVRLGLNSPPSLSDHWIQINPLSDEVQKKWASEFLESEKVVDPDVIQSLNNDPWYYHFGLAMENISSAISQRWKQWRSERVIGRVGDWCTANGINPASIYQDTEHSSPLRSSPTSPTVSAREEKPDARTVLLGAIAMMPLEDLLNLPIPPKFLLEVMKIDGVEGDKRPTHS